MGTNKNQGFTAEEKAAVKERAKERKAAATREEEKQACLDAIAAMPQPDRNLAKRVHEIITTNAPVLSPKTWYGMPAYAKDDKVVCSFKPATKFKTRYATLEFQDAANLDEGDIWPVGFALRSMGKFEEEKVIKLVKKAVS